MRAVIASVLLACLMSAFFNPLTTEAQKFEADLVIVNARVRTLDARQPSVEAVAVQGGRVVAVGASAEVRALAGPQTRVIDARGALVLPGFNDAHVHFLSGGFQLSSVDLRDAATPQEFAERLRRFSEKLPKGRWITGGDWDHERWAGAPLPTKELIDAFTPDHAVFVNRLDEGHHHARQVRRPRHPRPRHFQPRPRRHREGQGVDDRHGRPRRLREEGLTTELDLKFQI